MVKTTLTPAWGWRIPPRLTVIGLVTLVISILCNQADAATSITAVNTKSAVNLEVVASSSSCYMLNVETSPASPAASACDWSFATYFRGKLPYPAVTAEIQRAFWVTWTAPKQIRSFMGDMHLASTISVDVFITNDPLTLVRGDSRWLCLSGITPNGTFNCPFTNFGNYLVFWPPLTAEPGNLLFRELRAWSRKDLAGTGTVTKGTGTNTIFANGGTLDDIIGPSVTRNFSVEFTNGGWFYINLGAQYKIEDVWAVYGNNGPITQPKFGGSWGLTVPTAHFGNCKQGTLAKTDHESWVHRDDTSPNAQYIMIGVVSSNACAMVTSSMHIRRVAAFGPMTCTNTPTPTYTLTTVYPTYEYWGDPVSIAWPTWTVTPTDCFGLQSLTFQDASNTDLVASGVVIIDWVLQTITYQRPTGYDLFIKMAGVFSSSPPTTTAVKQIDFFSPCFTAVINAATFAVPASYQIVYTLPNSQTVLSFSQHSDTGTPLATNPLKCGNKSYITNQSWATVVAPADPVTQSFQLVINTNDYLLAGTPTVTLTVKFLKVLYMATLNDPVVVTLLHPCKLTAITTLQTISDITYGVTSAASMTAFVAFTDTVSVQYSIAGLCVLSYYIEDAATALADGLSISGMNIRVETSDWLLVGQTIDFKLLANSTPQQDNASQDVPFKVIFAHPCATSALSFSTAISDITITAFSGSDAFLPFTEAENDVEIRLSNPGLCGVRTYTIVETQPATFITISFPQLVLQSNNLADVKVWLVTLSAGLVDYPLAVAGTTTFTVTVVHVCQSTIIAPQGLPTPPDYQIQYSVNTPQTILSWYMHEDSQGVTQGDKLYCGIKSYSTGLPWLTVLVPTDPINQQFELQVTTIDPALAGPHTISLIVGFAVGFTQTITESLTVTLIHPCKLTQITTAQTINDIQYVVTAPMLPTAFTAFVDSVATEYGTPALCALTYTLSDPTDATNFGVSLNGLSIEVVSSNLLLIGQDVTLTLSANATPQQDTASSIVTFKVFMLSPCTTSIMTLPLAISNTSIVSGSGINSLLPFSPATNNVETTYSSLGLCGDRLYTIVEAQPKLFITVVPPVTDPLSNSWNLDCLATTIYDVGVWLVTLKAELVLYPLATPATKTFTVTVTHICQTTILATQSLASSSYQIQYSINTPQTIMTFRIHDDSVSVSKSDPLFCGLKKYTTGLSWLTVLPPADPLTQDFELQVTTNDYLLANTYSVNLVIGFLVSFTQTITQTISVTLLHPCKLTSITTSQTIPDISYVVTNPVLLTPFLAFDNTVAVEYGIPGLCSLTYSLADPTDATNFGVSLGTLSIGVVSSNLALIGQIVNLNLSAKATPLQDTASSIVTFKVIMVSPCTISTLSLSSAIASVSITAMSGVNQLRTFAPATNTKETSLSSPGLCGARIYSIVEAQPQNFISIIPPATSPLTNNWTLDCLANSLPDVGVWTVTLKAELQLYPTATPATKTFTVTVSHMCQTAVIASQVLTPANYQIQFSVTTAQTILSFTQNQDSAGTFLADDTYCGLKKYTVGATWSSWLSVLAPADPSSPFELQVTTNDPTKAGTYNVSVVIGFVNAGFTNTITQTISVTLLHPCKLTVITSTQSISDIIYIETNSAATTNFVAFDDSVALEYGISNLCGLTYFINDPTIATTYGVTTSGLSISVLTSNVSLIGTTQSFEIYAKATPLQDAVSQVVPFNVIIQTPCPTSVLTLPSAIASASITALSGVNQLLTFSPATNNKETTLSSLGLCGDRVYTIVEAQPATFVTVVSPAPADLLANNWTLDCLSNSILDVAVWTVTLKAELLLYPTATPATKTFTVTIIHICKNAVIQSQVLTPADYQIQFSITTAQTILSFTQNQDSSGNFLGDATYCGLKKYTVGATWSSWLSVLAPADPASPFELRVTTNDYNKTGTYSVTITVGFVNAAFTQTITQTVSVKLIHPCVLTTIYPGQTLVEMQYMCGRPTMTQAFIAFTDQVSIDYGVSNLCNLVYSLSPPLEATRFGVSLSGLTISLYTTDISLILQSTILTLQAQASPYQAVTDQLTFNVWIITDPCGMTTLSLQALTDITITATSGTSATQLFAPATSIYEDSIANTGFCGVRLYTIVEVPPRNFISIVSPPANKIYIQNWTLNFLSTTLADVGVHTVNLQAELVTYPSVLPATSSFTVTVLHICWNTVINSQTMTPTPYQIQYSVTTPQTILSFVMHKDTVGIAKANNMICEVKTYTTDQPWLTVLTPANPGTQNFQLQVTTNDHSLAGIYSVNLTIGFSRGDLTMTLTQVLSVTLIHPCKLTVITTSQTMPDKVYQFGDPVLLAPFTAFSDTISAQYGIADLCALAYTVSTAANAAAYGVTVDTPTLTISILTTDYLKIGSQVTLTVSSAATTYAQTTASQTFIFKVIVQDPCPNTSITLQFSTLPDLVYVATETPTIEPFALGTNSKSTLTSLPNLCGSLTYMLTNGAGGSYTFLSLNTGADPGQIRVQTNLIPDVGVYPVEFEVYLTLYPLVTHIKIPFQVTINNPCINAVLALPQTPAAVTITALSNIAATRTYNPATDSVGLAASLPDVCGARLYSIVEAIPAVFTTITSPAPLNPQTNDWTLTFKTNNLAVVGVYTVTLKATLQLYPSVPAITTSFQVTVLHICATTTITSKPWTPIPYQITYGVTSPNILSFMMHSDSISFAYTQPMICEIKTYTTDLPWVTIIPPANPLTTPFELHVLTNDYTLAGDHLLTITIGFIRADLPQTLVQTIPITLLHPCKVTEITTTQIIPNLSFMFGDPTLIHQFVDFEDTVSLAYNITNFCQLYYVLSDLTDATTFGVILGYFQLEFWTNDQTLIKQSKELTLTANAIPQQDQPSQILRFNVTVADPCPIATISLPTLMTAKEITSRTDIGDFQTFKPGVVSIEQAVIPPILGLCGPRTYTITDSTPGNVGNPMKFINITAPVSPLTGLWNTSYLSNDLADVKLWSLTLTGYLTNYPSVKTTRNYQVWVHHPCEFTKLEPQPISNMRFAMGFPQEIYQFFVQFNDTISQNYTEPQLCEDRTYDQVDGFIGNFLRIIPPDDPWADPFALSLFTTDPSNVGNYTVTMIVGLKNFPMVPALLIEFEVTIEFSSNQFPYFEPKLPSTVIVAMTNKPQSFSMNFPSIIDKDGDVVMVTGNFGAADFVQLQARNIFIKDTSAIRVGSYQCSLALFDGKDIVKYYFTLKITPALAEVAKAEIKPPEVKVAVQVPVIEFDAEAAFLAKQRAEELERLRRERANWSPYPPNPFFKEITNKGFITIGFTSDVVVRSNLTMFNNGTIYLSDLEMLPSPVSGMPKRELNRQLPRKNEQPVPVLQVEVLPGSPETNVTALAFWWEVTQETSKEMNIQIYFNEPLMVSINPIPDKLRITFNDPGLWLGINTKYMDKKARVMTKNLPKQVPLNAQTLEVSQSMQTAVVMVQLVANFVLSGAAQQLMNLINAQQLIVLLPLFDMQMPAVAQAFFNQLMKIAAFDIIDTAKYWDKWLQQPESKGFNENFISLGFDSMYFMNNMGTMFLGFVAYFIFLILLYILQACAVRWPNRWTGQFESWRESLFYNYLVAMVIESYSILSICALVSLNFISFENYGESIEMAVTFLFTAVIIFFPPLVTWYSVRNWERLDEIKHFYGHFFEELQLETGPSVLMYKNWFMLRRLLMAVICVYTSKLFFVQFAIFAWCSIINVVIMGKDHLFEEPGKVANEMINEVAIMLIMYTVICFSSFVHDVNAKQYMGYVCCVLIGAQLLLGLMKILISSVKGNVFAFKMWRARRHHRRQKPINKEKFHRRRRLVKVDDDEPMIEWPSEPAKDEQEEMAMQMIHQILGAENQRQLDRVVQKHSVVDLCKNDLNMLEQMVNDHFDQAELEAKAIIDNHDEEKKEVRAELTKIENMVDEFFDQQQQRSNEAYAKKELQNLSSFVNMFFDKNERDTRKLLDNVNVEHELYDLERYVDDFFEQQEKRLDPITAAEPDEKEKAQNEFKPNDQQQDQFDAKTVFDEEEKKADHTDSELRTELGMSIYDDPRYFKSGANSRERAESNFGTQFRERAESCPKANRQQEVSDYRLRTEIGLSVYDDPRLRSDAKMTESAERVFKIKRFATDMNIENDPLEDEKRETPEAQRHVSMETIDEQENTYQNIKFKKNMPIPSSRNQVDDGKDLDDLEGGLFM